MLCQCCMATDAIITAPYRCLTVHLCRGCYAKMRPMLLCDPRAKAQDEVMWLEHCYRMPAAKRNR